MGDGFPLAINDVEGDFTLRETMTIFVNDDVKPSLEAPRTMEANIGVSLYFKGRETEKVAAGSPELSWQEEASTSRTSADSYLATKDRAKSVIGEGGESDSDVDLDDLRMIDEGLTHFEVRLKGGLRISMIPLDRDLVVNTKEVVPTLVPLNSDVKGKTLKDINDSALSKRIAGLTLRVCIIV